MRALMPVLFSLIYFSLQSQNTNSFIIPKESLIQKLVLGDSLIYYQCHVENAVQQLSTASGQTLTSNSQKYSITDKYVVTKISGGYSVNYYTSSFTNFPNRRFSGLKIREKAYWDFKKERSFELNEKTLENILALEKKGREAMEYDYAITKYTTNQLIIKYKKDFKQLVIDGDYVLSRFLLK